MMRFRFWPRFRKLGDDRRRSSPEERMRWEVEQDRRIRLEREDLEQRLRYLEAEAELWARKELH